MPTFRKRPVEVEMVQWTGSNIAEIGSFVGLIDPPLIIEDAFLEDEAVLSVWCKKSNARVDVAVGGWVARERDGSGFYPITEREQAETYEPGEVPF